MEREIVYDYDYDYGSGWVGGVGWRGGGGGGGPHARHDGTWQGGTLLSFVVLASGEG
jgi:hypothetical protein